MNNEFVHTVSFLQSTGWFNNGNRKYEWKEIATICGEKINIIRKDWPALDKTKIAVAEYIRTHGGYSIANTNEMLTINEPGDNIYLLFLKKILYRRCTLYVFIQYAEATKRVRYVVYGSNALNHSAASFGTDLNHVDCHEIVNDLGDNFDKINFSPKNDTEYQIFSIIKNAFGYGTIIKPNE